MCLHEFSYLKSCSKALHSIEVQPGVSLITFQQLLHPLLQALCLLLCSQMLRAEYSGFEQFIENLCYRDGDFMCQFLLFWCWPDPYRLEHSKRLEFFIFHKTPSSSIHSFPLATFIPRESQGNVSSMSGWLILIPNPCLLCGRSINSFSFHLYGYIKPFIVSFPYYTRSSQLHILTLDLRLLTLKTWLLYLIYPFFHC